MISNITILLISSAAFIASLLWGYFDGGWEPWIVAALSFASILNSRDAFLDLFPIGRQLTPEQRLAKRERFRPLFQEYFLGTARKNYRGDAIIHDVSRLDDYPNGEDDGESISSWFRTGLMGTYNEGVLLGLRWTYLKETADGYEEVPNRKEENCTKVMLLGELPFESIETVDFEGDAYYNKPHLFCHFDFNGGPYRRLFYGQEFRLFNDSPWHFTEIAEYEGHEKQKKSLFWNKR